MNASTRGFVYAVFQDNHHLFRCNGDLRKLVLMFLGSSFDFPPRFHILYRKHLEEHYCSCCGKYKYFCHPPSSKRIIPMHHHDFYKKNFEIPLIKKIKIHPKLSLVELQREYSDVCMFPHKMFNYNTRPGRRIKALAIWTIQEWNDLYPEINIREDENYPCMVNVPAFLQTNPLFYPIL